MVKITYEERALRFVREKLTVDTPNWKVANDILIAYPILEDPPVITFDPTYEMDWNINREENVFVSSLATLLFEMQSIFTKDAVKAGIAAVTIDSERKSLHEKIDLVKRELGMLMLVVQFASSQIEDLRPDSQS